MAALGGSIDFMFLAPTPPDHRIRYGIHYMLRVVKLLFTVYNELRVN